MSPGYFEGEQMFIKVILVTAALLLGWTSDDCSAAEKKRKKTPLENSESIARGTDPTSHFNSQPGLGNHTPPMLGGNISTRGNQVDTRTCVSCAGSSGAAANKPK